MLAKAQEGSPFAAADEDEGEGAEMMAAMMKYMPLRASDGKFTEEMLQGMIQQLNEDQKNPVVK